MTKLSKRKIYAMYKGEDILAIGNSDEICNKMGIKYETFCFYRTKIYNQRIKNRPKRRVIVKLEDNYEEE